MDDDDEDGPPLPPGTKNYLTQAGHARLREELHALWVLERPKVVEIVPWAAGNGDRSENGDYQYGKKRLREIDRRVRFLQKRLAIAEVIDPAAQPQRDRVFFGATVTYVDEADTERTITIVGIDEADMAQGKVSLTAPISMALIKAKAKRGDEVSVFTPRGIEVVEVLSIAYPEPA